MCVKYGWAVVEADSKTQAEEIALRISDGAFDWSDTDKGGRSVSVRKQKEPQFSSSISGFCKLMEDVQKDYAWNFEEVNRMDKLTQDYLHKLELDNLDYKERAKIATQLARCRQSRREHKDTTEILDPLVQFLDSDRGKTLLNLMREVLGKTRKAEDRMETRTYIPRVLEQSNDR